MAAKDPFLPARNSGTEFLDYIDSTKALSVTVRQPEKKVLMIHIAGELDMLTGPPLKEHFNRLLDTRPERLIVDLSEVTFLGSFGLAVLLGARHAAAQQDTTFQLNGTSHRAVARSLQITGLDQLFEMCPPGEVDTPPA